MRFLNFSRPDCLAETGLCCCLGDGSGEFLRVPDAVDDEHARGQTASTFEGLLHVDGHARVVNLVLKDLWKDFAIVEMEDRQAWK